MWSTVDSRQSTVESVRSQLLVALALLMTACDSGKPATTASSDPCHPAPPVRCEVDKDCAPYFCKSSFCDQKCTSSNSCQPGFACNAGSCVKQGTCGTCSGDYDCGPGKKCNLTTSLCQ